MRDAIHGISSSYLVLPVWTLSGWSPLIQLANTVAVVALVSRRFCIAWTKESAFQPRSKIPVLFQGSHYLCTSKGLIVSKDHGATWQTQGTALDLWQGPFFGADEKTMVTAGLQGVYKTIDAGTTWTKVSALRTNLDPLYTYSTKWFGTYSWDPVHDVIYTTAMSHPAFKSQLSMAASSKRQNNP